MFKGFYIDDRILLRCTVCQSVYAYDDPDLVYCPFCDLLALTITATGQPSPVREERRQRLRTLRQKMQEEG